MSDGGEKTCPLCAEEMDLTDQQLKPCKCGYEICVWCWNHIIEMAEKDETEGRCPACRNPYDKERIVSMAANHEKVVTEASVEKKQTSRKRKSKIVDSRRQLSNVRVIQRNLVYIVGLPLNLADEELLQRKEYFAQYGKVLKVSMSRTAAGAIQHFPNNTCSVYITYSREEEAVRCIQSAHGFILDGRPLRACFGTTKYCHAWLRSVPCTNPDCLYLHEIGLQEDSFTKDEMISAYTRKRVQQITGATSSFHQRAGSALPAPADGYRNDSSASVGRPSSSTANSNSATNARGSPPNCSSGRSASLPAGALWATRVSSNQLPLASVPSSNGPLKQNSETCSPVMFSTAVTSTSQVSLLPSEAGKEAILGEESDSSQETAKIETLEPIKQYIGAEDGSHTSENPVLPASSSMHSHLHFTQSLMEKNTPSSAVNAFDRSMMSNEPEFSNYSNGATDGQIQSLCSDLSSLGIDRHQKSLASFFEQSRERSPFQMNRESVSCADGIYISREKSDLRKEMQTQVMQVATPEMEGDLLSFNAQRYRDPEVIIEGKYSPNPSLSSPSLSNPRGYSSQLTTGVGPTKAITNTIHRRTNSISQPSNVGALPNGYSDNVFSCVGDSGSIGETCPLSYEDRRMHMERIEGETANGIYSTAVDTGENNIISNILSMDFDPWDDSLASPQNLAKLLGENDNQQGSLRVSSARKLQNSNQSRFSFAREEEPVNPSTDFQSSLSYIEQSFSHGQDFLNSRSYQLDSFGTRGISAANNEGSNGFSNYSQLSSNKLSVSRSQVSAPPGFSAPNRAPPPGFTSHERMEHDFDSLSGSHMLDRFSFLRNQYQAPPVGNVSNGDIEFMDPAILAVGRVPNGLNVSSLDASSSFPTQLSSFENEARLQLLMQRSLSPHQNQRFTEIGDNFSPFNDAAYGISSRVVEHTLANNLSPFSQLTPPQSRNSVMSNGHWEGWNAVQSDFDLGVAGLQNERLGFNKFFSGYEESKFRMPNSGNLYNRTFGI